MTALLEATGVTKRFAGIVALTDVTVRIEPGELVALIGPNGAGKTTLFNCLSGVLRPEEGTIEFQGTDIDGMLPHTRARLGMARTFQRIELFGAMTVRDHLLVADRARSRAGGFWKDLVGRSRPTDDERRRCDETLSLVGLDDVAERPASSLSLGRGRIVELARALMCRPDLMFLDEPSSGLDANETAEMATVLRTVQRERGTAILLCEHDVPFVSSLASRTYVLDVGRLIADGPTAEVLDDERVRIAYLGRTG